jgi:hypothetical protein
VLGAHSQTPEDLQAGNSNLVGGDIGSGSYQLDQQMVFRPLPGWFRHQTPLQGLYMGGASTHPGGGVHGAAGANAARMLLMDLRLAPVGRGLQAGAAAGRVLARSASRLAGPRAEDRARVAAEGVGPLLQHEAWLLLRDAVPSAVMAVVREEFESLAWQPYAQFRRQDGTAGPLGAGDRLAVVMPLAGTFELEVVSAEAASLTLRTRGDHPEAGRVTVVAEPSGAGRVRVSIRTRTRANGWRNRLVYAAGGQLLQARLWQMFLERLASRVGGEVLEGVHANTARVHDEPADARPLPSAVGPLQEAR